MSVSSCMGITTVSKSTVPSISDGTSSSVNRGVRYRGVHYWGGCGMGSRSDSFNDGVKTVNVIGDVLDHAECAVRFGDGVGALDDVSVAVLRLGLVITGVGVSYSVIVGVFGVSLKLKKLGFLNSI